MKTAILGTVIGLILTYYGHDAGLFLIAPSWFIGLVAGFHLGSQVAFREAESNNVGSSTANDHPPE